MQRKRRTRVRGIRDRLNLAEPACATASSLGHRPRLRATRFQFRRRNMMADRLIKIPNPDHPISIEPNRTRVVVKVGGKLIADTSDALTLREASYPPVQYVPRISVDMAALARTDQTTYGPSREDASYYGIPAAGD